MFEQFLRKDMEKEIFVAAAGSRVWFCYVEMKIILFILFDHLVFIK